MAEYDPPEFNVPIFNPAYFITGEDEISKSFLNKNYLKFPIGQGSETVPDLFIENTNIHLGNSAGSINQSIRAIAIGDFSGAVNQGNSSVSIGNFAGNDNQASGAVAIGLQSGQNNQGANSVAIGSYAGYSGGNLGEDSIAIGNASRATGTEAVSIGHNAISGQNSISVGHNATTSTFTNAVAIGHNAISSGENSISMGHNASTSTFTNAVAIGHNAISSGQNSVSMGHNATTSTFTNSVAIGNGATASNNNEVKLSDKASFLGDATQGWAFGDLGAGLSGWAGLQHIGYARNGTNYALLQNTSTNTTSLGGVSQVNLNVGNSLMAYILPSGSALGDGLHINTAGISYNGTTKPTGTSVNRIGFRWKGSTAQVGVAVDNNLSGFFASLSDRRIKTKIVDYEDGLTDIMKLKPRQYEIIKVDVAKCDFQDNNCIIRDLSGNTIEYDSEGNCCDETETYGEKQTGLILDEVRQIFPSVVEGGDENSLGTINYAGLVPMLIKAVQQQQEQIELLKLEIESLK